MLKDKLEPNQTYTLKLASGEEIIARLVSSDMINYVVSKPVACIISPQGMGLTQWVMTANMDANSLPIRHITNRNMLVWYFFRCAHLCTRVGLIAWDATNIWRVVNIRQF